MNYLRNHLHESQAAVCRSVERMDLLIGEVLCAGPDIGPPIIGRLFGICVGSWVVKPVEVLAAGDAYEYDTHGCLVTFLCVRVDGQAFEVQAVCWPGKISKLAQGLSACDPRWKSASLYRAGEEEQNWLAVMEDRQLEVSHYLYGAMLLRDEVGAWKINGSPLSINGHLFTGGRPVCQANHQNGTEINDVYKSLWR